MIRPMLQCCQLPLAGHRGHVVILLNLLPKGWHLPEVNLLFCSLVDREYIGVLMPKGIGSRMQTYPGWCADGTCVHALEPKSLFYHLIQMRRFEIQTTIGTKSFVTDIVSENEHDIGFVSFDRPRKPGQQY